MIKITYVTITYNAEKVLQCTLDSVLKQDYPDIVHLIIDGASTDRTMEIVNNYIERSNAADNGHSIQVTSEPDKGIYDAMNKGLRSLDGDYVCFLNAGDFLPTPDTVSRIAATIGNNGDSPQCDLPAVLYGDTDIVDDNGHFLYHRRLSPPEQLTWKSFLHGMLAYRLRHCYTLRPAVPLFGRCRLVYPYHEGRRQRECAFVEPAHGGGQLHPRRTDNPPSP